MSQFVPVPSIRHSRTPFAPTRIVPATETQCQQIAFATLWKSWKRATAAGAGKQIKVHIDPATAKHSTEVYLDVLIGRVPVLPPSQAPPQPKLLTHVVVAGAKASRPAFNADSLGAGIED